MVGVQTSQPPLVINKSEYRYVVKLMMMILITLVSKRNGIIKLNGSKLKTSMKKEMVFLSHLK